jgi:hypothetical protein
MGPLVLVLASLVSVKAVDLHDWELDNIAQYRAGELNDAELGLANIQNALSDRAYLQEVAEWLRQPDGMARLIKMVANPEFQEQAKEAAELLKMDGEMPSFLRLEEYASRPLKDEEHSVAEAILSQAREATTAFHAPSGRSASAASRKSSARMFGGFGGSKAKAKAPKLSGLDELQQNPSPPKYWDPLSLATQEFWEQSNEATIGFLRHAEIKHGRVAMAGFIGYCIHENGIHFPWKYPGVDWAEFEKMSAPAVWDNLPIGARIQILVGIGILEAWGENSVALEADGEAHYMRGGKPGYYPTFDQLYHPVPFNLYDPFNLFEEQTEEQKARRLFAEINNGRLAMIGLFSLLLASKSDQAVPILNGLIKRYDGDVMAPLSPGFSVSDLGV